MKKTLFSVFALSIGLISLNIILTSSSQGRANAANSGNTGAPGEATTCRSCHGTGFGTTVTVQMVDSNQNPVTSYIPGQVYAIVTTVSTTVGVPRSYGFQTVSLIGGTTNYNAWSQPAPNTRIASAGSRSYAEHRGPSPVNTFAAGWTAPQAGSGPVTFFAGGAAVNLNGGTSGDGGNTATLIVQENTSVSLTENQIAKDLKVYPNPVTNLLTIQASNSLNTRINILDLSGRLMRNEFINGTNLTIDLSELSQGLYFLQWEDENQNLQSKKIIKR